MRFTISRKIAAGMALILFLGTASMLVIYQGLSTVRQSMHKLLTAKEPASAASHEMEIQIHAIASDVLGYLNSPDPHRRAELASHSLKFTTFLNRFRSLSELLEVKRLADELEGDYADFRALGDTLMERRDEQEASLIKTFENFEEIDRIIDVEIGPQFRHDPAFDRPLARRKFESLMAFEGEVAKIGLSLANYQRVRKPEDKERLFARQQQGRRELVALKKVAEPGREQDWLGTVERLFDEAMRLTSDAVTLDERINEGLKRLTDLEQRIDLFLDDRIQVAAREDLIAPSRAADQATSEVIRRIGVLVPLFILSACVVTLGLVRVISAPIKGLMAGTRVVAQGNLTYRIRPRGGDELAQLADEFNRMVAQLESTTVSKTALEASELKLKEMVAQLRQEIGERIRAEEEQARLQASLRQAETMSAMGSLVAGVAHQVRNPLFGISSVLDAMEARLGGMEEYQKYLIVLRREVKRLTELIHELFEYGKPSSSPLSPASIGDVIRDAVNARGPLAEQLGVRIAVRGEAMVDNMLMDRTRLMRVFENLLENAIQHSPTGGLVAIETRETSENGVDSIECVVKDSGSGIAVDDLPHVFEPFFTRRRGGTGLGLSIAQRIMEEHGGRIVAANRPEGGGAMTLYLPVVRSQVHAP